MSNGEGSSGGTTPKSNISKGGPTKTALIMVQVGPLPSIHGCCTRILRQLARSWGTAGDFLTMVEMSGKALKFVSLGST
jgi:hypothetical protein